MKAAVFQTDPVLLDVEANLADLIEKIGQGRDQGADLMVFPELALTGYFVGRRYHQAALRLDSPQIKKLVKATKGTAAIVGFIEESPSMNFYNSALVAVDGRIEYAYRKLNLPNYGVFEERKIFSPGKQIPIFRFKEFNIAVFICNDVWHPALPYLGVCQKADIFVTIINSSDSAMGKRFSNLDSWSIVNTFYSRIFGIYNITANRAGEEVFSAAQSLPDSRSKWTEEEEDPDVPEGGRFRFWGGSEIVNPYGETMVKAALYEPDVIYGGLEREVLRRKRIMLPYLRNDDPYFTHRELGRILFGKDRPAVGLEDSRPVKDGVKS